MARNYAHLLDEELLLLADGELPARRVVEMNAHLEACWECRSRQRQVEETIADFMQVYHGDLDPQLPPIEGPRALLKARLEQSTRPGRDGWWALAFPGNLLNARLMYVAASLCLIAGALVIANRSAWFTPNHPKPVREVSGIEPNRRLTPGAARLVDANEVCRANYSDDTELVPAEVRQQVFHEYGLAGSHLQGYQLDYLISPQLGGTGDVTNLWPEQASSTGWNMRVKDALENRLHQLVCEGKINLPTAQRDLAGDWISAYKRYFHTDRPLEPPS